MKKEINILMNNENENIPSTETLRIQYSAWEIMPFAEGREITRSIVTVFQLLPTRIFGGVPLFRCRCFRPTRTQANFLSLFYVYVTAELDWTSVLINFDEMCVCLSAVDVRGGEVKQTKGQ